MIYYACRDGARTVSTIHKSGFIIGWWSPICLIAHCQYQLKKNVTIASLYFYLSFMYDSKNEE